ncbi:tripartite tricarboxylate transporter TctB family protein [Paraburkholderia sp. J7]|uniref:tripartite tricarboxylate transporter TctB family protein n=1 Tax=Paraburkholderia sp. J7 TaxID=2805438 RepID=UPI002AB6CA1E|nr:tripartite tricarboxylate transporter TctB family protein [Paraburkholderia sp. J7]
MSTTSERRWFGVRAREYYGGALMMLIGLGAVVQGTSYQIGSLTAMGSGFFPVALGVILVLLGVWIAGTAHRVSAEEEAKERRSPLEWRGWVCILGSVVAFVVLGKYGGLLPATFAVVFISALGDRQNSWISALLLAVAMTCVCVVVFWWALQVQFPLFTWG